MTIETIQPTRELTPIQRAFNRYEFCEYKSCPEKITQTCWISTWDQDAGEDLLLEWRYCYDHCYYHGFCWGCGGYFAGIESFDFGGYVGNIEGFCQDCSDAFKQDTGEHDWQDEEWPYDVYESFGSEDTAWLSEATE